VLTHRLVCAAKASPVSQLSRRHRTRSSHGEPRPFESLRTVNAHAAGVDSGAHDIMAGVPDGDDQQSVRAFGSSTAALASLADWCIDRGIETVAMESTGVSWMPLFETLEARGIQGCLSSAQSLTQVPGRTSDVLDCQWLQTLHSYGLLSASFRPEADGVALRTLLRHRAHLLEHRAPLLLHRHKAL
jgi:transposase